MRAVALLLERTGPLIEAHGDFVSMTRIADETWKSWVYWEDWYDDLRDTIHIHMWR